MSPRVRRLVCLLLFASLALPTSRSRQQSLHRPHQERASTASGVIRLVCSLVGCNVVRRSTATRRERPVQQGSLFLVDSVLGLEPGRPAELHDAACWALPPPSPTSLAAAPAGLQRPLRDDRERRPTPTILPADEPSLLLRQHRLARLPRAARRRHRAAPARRSALTARAGPAWWRSSTRHRSEPSALGSVLEPGYDFTRNVLGGDETR
jgi:hypothetical protein